MLLITGASGFIGQAVLRAIRGSYPEQKKIIALINRNEHFLDAFDFITPLYCKLDELNNHADSLKEVDQVIHLASKNIDTDGSGFEEVNVKGTSNLITFARHNNIKKIIYVSSTGVYGHKAFLNADENTTYQPDTPYSKSKSTAEQLLKDAHSSDLQIIILRQRFIIGQGDQHVIPRFIKAAQKLPFIVRGGKALISFIDVDDLAHIILRYISMSKSLKTYEVVHVVSDEKISLGKILEVLSALFSIHKKRINLPYWPLYVIIRAREILLGIDPESKRAGSLSSIRLKFIAQNNHFSNKRLMERFPDLQFTSFKNSVEKAKAYYASFLTSSGDN